MNFPHHIQKNFILVGFITIPLFMPIVTLTNISKFAGMDLFQQIKNHKTKGNQETNIHVFIQEQKFSTHLSNQKC